MMDREQWQALLSSDRMVKTEGRTQGKVYRIHHLCPSFPHDDDDDTTMIV